jgi:hypothetical protein
MWERGGRERASERASEREEGGREEMKALSGGAGQKESKNLAKWGRGAEVGGGIVPGTAAPDVPDSLGTHLREGENNGSSRDESKNCIHISVDRWGVKTSLGLRGGGQMMYKEQEKSKKGKRDR